jgi:hypothetical protein
VRGMLDAFAVVLIWCDWYRYKACLKTFDDHYVYVLMASLLRPWLSVGGDIQGQPRQLPSLL